MREIVIPARFCGPATSGNGGYTAGVVAALVGGGAEVTLRRPVPLDVAMEVARAGGGRVAITAGGETIVEAEPAAVEIEAPDPPSFEQATGAAARFPWAEHHPYPRCFVCGTDRGEGDGLRIGAGPVAGRALVAAPWVPAAALAATDGRVAAEFVWSALDCPSWFGFYAFQDRRPLGLLGRIAARIERRPLPGERCVATGWCVGVEGRKIRVASALFGDRGELIATARATWIESRPDGSGTG